MRLPFSLQGMENALAKEGKTCPAIPHPFQQLQFVDCSFDHPIASRQGETRFHSLLVSFHASDKALQLADLTSSHFFKPGVELLPSARAQHLSELLNQLICLIHLRMQRSKQSQRFLLLGLQFLRSSKQEKHCISCEHSGAWKLAGRRGLLPAFWKVTNQLPVDVAIGDGVACSDQFPMQLCDVVTTRFPPLCNHFEVGIEPGPSLG